MAAIANPLIEDILLEYRRYRKLGEQALGQLSDAALNQIPAADGNSAAMIVRHLSGNLASRFTDFLTTDGEKPWRDREAEFAVTSYSRSDVDQRWARGWAVLEESVAALSDEDLARTVTIRGQSLTVNAALLRSVTHAAYHVGQIVLLARIYVAGDWQSLSIPRGGSAAYNLSPDRERGPR